MISLSTMKNWSKLISEDLKKIRKKSGKNPKQNKIQYHQLKKKQLRVFRSEENPEKSEKWINSGKKLFEIYMHITYSLKNIIKTFKSEDFKSSNWINIREKKASNDILNWHLHDILSVKYCKNVSIWRFQENQDKSEKNRETGRISGKEIHHIIFEK